MREKMKSKSNNSHASDVKKKAKLFLENIKNANNLLDILMYSQSDDNATVVASVNALHKVFVQLIASEEMYLEKIPENDEGLDKAKKFRFWLITRYNDACDRLVELLAHKDKDIKKLSLSALMKIVKTEGHHPIRKLDGPHDAFPFSRFQPTLKALLSTTTDQVQLFSDCEEYLAFDDVRYQAMRVCHRQIKAHTDKPNQMLQQNVLNLLERLNMPAAPEDDRLTNFLTKCPEGEKVYKVMSHKEHTKLFTTLWLDFLRVGSLTTGQYRRVLTLLHDRVMPHLTNPLLLAGFLTQAYAVGGAISLLALNGIFILINKYNLEEPDFFPKLYALVNEGVLHAKYRARFFYLLDLFLTSTHLPTYLVAAFIKRLARVSLDAPPDSLSIICHLIQNLFVRHPTCKVLIHSEGEHKDEKEDPFIMEEKDPAKCKAMESSLWELKSIEGHEGHYLHTISGFEKKMFEVLPRTEEDVSDLFELTTSKIFSKEKRRKYEEAHLNFEPADGLFMPKEDEMKPLWTL